MTKFLYAIPFVLLLSLAAVRAEDKPNMPATPAPGADKEVTLTGQVFAKKKDAPADVAASFKAEGATYQLVSKDDDTAKAIKGCMNQKAEVKGTLKGDTITVSSIESKKPGKAK